ncbi:MAG: hypothetical protein ABI959_08905 [Candidatus Dormiibacterota bacterium]
MSEDYVEGLEGQGLDDKEVGGPDRLGMVSEEGRAALIALAFALCNEQAMHLHLAPGLARNTTKGAGVSLLLHAYRANEPVGSMGAVRTGKFGYFVGALLLASFFLWAFSPTLEMIDILLLTVLVIGISLWTKFDSRRRTTRPS